MRVLFAVFIVAVAATLSFKRAIPAGDYMIISAVTTGYPAPFAVPKRSNPGLMPVRTIFISPPQQGQRNAGRLRHANKTGGGLRLSRHCKQ
jgi:hypothetical protein